MPRDQIGDDVYVDATGLEQIVRHYLERQLFTLEEVQARIAEPDMLGRPGAQLLRRALRC